MSLLKFEQRKKVVATLKLIVNAGAAKPAPPVGPVLGQAGLNIMSFCKDFNAKTAQYKDGVPMRVNLRVYPDKSYDWDLRMPHMSWFVMKAVGLSRGSGRTGHEEVGQISLKHVYEIAKIKQRDMNGLSLENTCKAVISVAQRMGVRVVKLPEDARS